MTNLEQPGLPGLTSSQQAGPAKTSATQASRPGLRETEGIYSGKLIGLLATLDPDTSCWKTSQLSLLQTGETPCEPFSGHLPPSGMMRNGTLYELEALRDTLAPVPPTQGSGSSLWPTPTANGSVSASMDAVGRERERLHPQHRYTLATKVHQKLWPTPVAHETRLGYQNRNNGKKGTQKSLTTEVIDRAGGRLEVEGHLHSRWVCWLMGLPLDWFDIHGPPSRELAELPSASLIGPRGCGRLETD